MHKERHWIRRFCGIHLLIAFPVLLTSIIITFILSYKAEEVEEIFIHQQLETVSEKILEQYVDYQKECILLASRRELHSDNMVDNPVKAYYGLELLDLVNYIDSDTSYIFMDYGTDYVYSPNGIASKKTFFSKSVTFTEESAQKGLTAIEAEENVISFLYVGQKNGYLMYSLNSGREAQSNIKVIFLKSFQNIMQLLSAKYENQFFELEALDGSRLVVACDSNGDKQVIAKEEWESMEIKEQLSCRQVILDEVGMTIRFYYDKSEFLVNKWLIKLQMVNWGIILLGSVITAVMSWKYSKKRIDELVFLENAAKGTVVKMLPEKNVYGKLQKIILEGFYENKVLEKNILEQKREIQDKTIHMIFEGVYKDLDRLEIAFQELGYKSCPKRYFVGIISTDESLMLTEKPSVIEACLNCYVNNDGKVLLLYLYELEQADENQLQRRRIAEEVRDYLHQQGISKVRIGMSRIYENPLMIDRAYSEAVQELKIILTGKNQDFCGCCDASDSYQYEVMFEEAGLLQFEKALYEQDLEEAESSFKSLLGISETKECSKQNRIYLRCEILQYLVKYLKTEDVQGKTTLIRECLNIDVSSLRDYTKSVSDILQRCLKKYDDDSFNRMLKYVNENYYNCNLTGEDVAKVGGISKNYLSRMFRNRLNMSYIEYLTTVRMDKARMLLRTTDKKINEIAELVGYMNTVSFRRVFRERFGVNASEYRAKEGIRRKEEEKET